MKTKTDLEKQLEKRNILINFLIIIILFIFLCGICVILLYFNRTKFSNNHIYKDAKRATREIKARFSDESYEFIENYHNSAYRLNIKSAYGDNQGVHPKVLYFEDNFGGYKYWMVYSPYPYGDDSKENPHIMVSNDLINWKEPDGFKNPLIGKPNNYKSNVVYNSDPHLVYNSDTKELECYYRMVDDENDLVYLYRLKTKDGINWGKKEEIMKSKRSEHDFISPSIIYENHMYKIWYVNEKRNLVYEESNDGYHYGNLKKINHIYTPSSYKTWHLDVIHTENGYEMLTVAYENWDSVNNMNLYYFKSKDGINFGKGDVILRPSINSWDNKGFYRSSFIYVNGTYYVYYSGISCNMERGIGLSYGRSIYNLKGLNIR